MGGGGGGPDQAQGLRGGGLAAQLVRTQSVGDAAHQLVHEGDVRDGEAESLDAAEALLVRESGHLRGRGQRDH